MSKTPRRPASDTRLRPRSLMELSAAASRAIDDGLLMSSASLIAGSPDGPPLTEPAANTQDGTAAQVPGPTLVELPVALNEAPRRNGRPANCDSSAEMLVNIAKDYHNNACENIKLALNTALDHAKDSAEKREGDGALKGGSILERNFVNLLRATAAEFQSEALEMMKANVISTMEYARELAGTTTTADGFASCGPHRYGCGRASSHQRRAHRPREIVRARYGLCVAARRSPDASCRRIC